MFLGNYLPNKKTHFLIDHWEKNLEKVDCFIEIDKKKFKLILLFTYIC